MFILKVTNNNVSIGFGIRKIKIIKNVCHCLKTGLTKISWKILGAL